MSVIFINPYRFAAATAYDADAQAYITAVETADGQALETGVKDAINAFVVGCKADGIWSAIKASCILAGARTLNGALQPLVGAAPTNFNFVSGDYGRKTGLRGDGITKYLNSNRTNNSDPQDNHHMASYLSVSGINHLVGTALGVPGDSAIAQGAMRSRATIFTLTRSLGFNGLSRSISSNAQFRQSGTTSTVSGVSSTPGASPITIFSLGFTASIASARISFYSIGESLDLALLDARVTTLINALGAAIP